MLNVIMLSVVMLSVVMLSVVMLSVVAQFYDHKSFYKLEPLKRNEMESLSVQFYFRIYDF